MASIREQLRLPPGAVDLRAIDSGATPGFDGGRSKGRRALEEMGGELAQLQEKLFAHGYTGGHGSVLLVLQGMDTSGKGGVLKHTAGFFDPGGLRITSFKAPTKEELTHDFLWRVERHVPAHGEIAVFDRSHYEDVLVARVHQLAAVEEIERRYGAINDFEQRVADSGTAIVKVMLHISPQTQRARLLARLDDPTKQWKFKAGDVDERQLWPAYRSAYEIALERCNTAVAPWYVVPSDRKWYRNWAIGMLLLETLREQGLDWPEPDYDIDQQRARLEDENPELTA